MKGKVHTLAFLAFAIMFLLSGIMLLRDRYRSEREKEANLMLADELHQAKELQEQTQEQAEEQKTVRELCPKQERVAAEVPKELPVLPEYEELWEQNKDLAGWLVIEDLGIDYAVMFTPDDPEYYLHRGFDGKEAKSGSLFIGEGWKENAGNTIIYGHHMKDGTMFGKLVRYSSENYAREHPYVQFDTLREKGKYQIIAAFYSKIYSLKERDVFRYYWYIDLSSKERFEDYVSEVKKASLYDTGVGAVYGDQLLTLSTCSYHEKEGRFVVVAKKIE